MLTVTCAALLIAAVAGQRTAVRYDRFEAEAADSARDAFSARACDAPAGARHEALRRVRAWHAQHDAAAAPAHWESIGPFAAHSDDYDQTGRVNGIIISPADPENIVVGTSGGGIWRSTDGGTSFRPVSDDQDDLSIAGMAMAPSNPNVIYAATGSDHVGYGVLKSTDGGAHWRLVTTPAFARSIITRIAVDPHDENVVWMAQWRALDSAGTLQPVRALMKSVDGGATWRSMFPGLINDFLIASDDGATILAGAARTTTIGTGGVYRSTDGGASWQLVLPQGSPEVPPEYFFARAGGTLYTAGVDADDAETIAGSCRQAATAARRGPVAATCRTIA